MCMKMCIHYSPLRKLASYKVYLCFTVLYDSVIKKNETEDVVEALMKERPM